MSISKIKTKSLALSSVTSDIILDNTIGFVDLNFDVSDNIQSTKTTVQSNSSTNWNNVLANQYAHSNFLPLSGGVLIGTIVGDVSATGAFCGDGSKLTGIVAGDAEATTLVRQQSAVWESTYTTFKNASSTFLTSETDSQTLTFNEETRDLSISNGNTVSLSALIDDTGADTEVRDLTANWESTYTNVQSNSATWDGKTTLSGVVDYLSANNVVLSSAQIGSLASNTTFYVRSQKVGINAEDPNHALTVVGNISATGVFYGDGSQLTGIVAGDTVATTLVRSNSANWDLAPSVYTTVQTNSATDWNNSLANQYTHSNFLPLSGGNLTGAITTTSTISSSQTISASGARVITGLPSDSIPVYYITVLTQGDYDAIVSPDPNTLYFIKP